MISNQSSLLFNRSTENKIAQFLSNPSHALLITGPDSGGKTTVLNSIAAKLLDLAEDSLKNSPNVLFVGPEEDKKGISIDAVHKINHFLSLAIPNPSKNGIKRLVIIDDANKLSLDAQNALLKNLEEPPKDTVFLLSARNHIELLPTIISRLTVIKLTNPPKKELKQFLINEFKISDATAEKAINMSGGIVGLSIAICLNTADHNLIKASETARTLLSGKRYTKVALINKLTKNLDLTKDTLYILQQMASQSLESSKNEAQAKKWQDILTSTYKAERQIDKNNNLRLTLTSLMLHL